MITLQNECELFLVFFIFSYEFFLNNFFLQLVIVALIDHILGVNHC
jgi:hypothetical protein